MSETWRKKRDNFPDKWWIRQGQNIVAYVYTEAAADAIIAAHNSGIVEALREVRDSEMYATDFAVAPEFAKLRAALTALELRDV